MSAAHGVRLRDESDGRAASEDRSSYLAVKIGDIVVNKLSARDGAFGRSSLEGIVSPAYWVLSASPEFDSRYIDYFLHSSPAISEIGRLSKFMPPAQYDIAWEDFGRMLVPKLPLEEQRRIADFLDDQVARIDKIVALRSHQCDLINAWFDGALREAVLGAGQQSLGWATAIGDDRTLRPIGTVLQLRGEKNDPIRFSQVLSLTAARGVIPYEEKGDIGNKASEDISRYNVVRKGDLVLNSMNVIIGSVGLSAYDGVLSPVYYVLYPLPSAEVSNEFVALHFRIREFQRQLIKLGYGILDHRMRIPWVNLRSEKLAIPPRVVQLEIVDRVSSLDAQRLDALAAIGASQDALFELRRALITAAVTGELDVTTARRGVPV